MSRRLALILVAAACGCGSADAPPIDTQAMEAYLGLDSSIDKALNLAFVGMNSAATANIAPETAAGDRKGNLVVTGQVDQGTSAKTIRVDTLYDGYSDDGATFYATDPAAPPLLALELHGIPYGTLSGMFLGQFTMSGLYVGPLTVQLTFDGQLQPVGNLGAVARVPYSTHLHGTAVSDYGTYVVDFTR